MMTADVDTIGPDASVHEAARMISRSGHNRLPVVEDGRLIGMVSLGDLAVQRDRGSLLGEISASPPNE
jgi:CBS domain-containing protein